VFHVSIWGGLELCLGGLGPPKPPHGDGTETVITENHVFVHISQLLHIVSK